MQRRWPRSDPRRRRRVVLHVGRPHVRHRLDHRRRRGHGRPLRRRRQGAHRQPRAARQHDHRRRDVAHRRQGPRLPDPHLRRRPGPDRRRRRPGRLRGARLGRRRRALRRRRPRHQATLAGQPSPRDFEEDCGNTSAECNGAPRAPPPRLPQQRRATAHGGRAASSTRSTTSSSARLAATRAAATATASSTEHAVGGPGGGRIVLVALRADATGAITIHGTVDTERPPRLRHGNDSGGGGAGGTVFVVGDQVRSAPRAHHGRRRPRRRHVQRRPDSPGASTAPRAYQQTGAPATTAAAAAAAASSSCSRGRPTSRRRGFDVSGALGGSCTICQGEAGGGAGELQLDGAYVGEVCDGYDNDFDGMVDEELGNDLRSRRLRHSDDPRATPRAACPDLRARGPACVGPRAARHPGPSR
jgi:hypothetical protein